jgi:purine-nucleoside phosphorylase
MMPASRTDHVREAANFIESQLSSKPEIALILGSGLGALAETVRESDIPYYPVSTVVGHEGRLVVGSLAGRNVAVFQGRIHMYEGYAPEDVTFPIRLARTIGAHSLIVTNAAGGISKNLHPGSLMWITDHIDWTGSQRSDRGPTIGSDFEKEALSRARFRTGFYDSDWQRRAEAAIVDSEIELSQGTYLWTRGPSYETPAEIRAFSKIGADAVGMSTVPEVVEAARLGMSVVGLSTITNYAAGVSDEALDHSEVLAVGRRVRSSLEQIVLSLIQQAPSR